MFRSSLPLAVLLVCACSSSDPSPVGSGGSGGAGTSTSSASTGGAGGAGGQTPEGCVPHLVAKGATLRCDAAGCDQLHDGPPEGPDWCTGICSIDAHCFGGASCYFREEFDTWGFCALPCDAGTCETPLVCAEGRCVMNP